MVEAGLSEVFHGRLNVLMVLEAEEEASKYHS